MSTDSSTNETPSNIGPSDELDTHSTTGDVTKSETHTVPMRAIGMQAVHEVDTFLRSCRTEETSEATWRQSTQPESAAQHSLYHGGAGIALFYLELFQATGERDHLDTATAAGNALLHELADTDFLTIGMYSGWPGYVFVLNEIAKASGDPKFRQGAISALDNMMNQSEPLGAGIGWIEPMPFSDITGLTGDREVLDLSIGAAGAGVVLLYAHRQGLHSQALGWARQVADRLLEMAVDSDSGLNWLMMADMPFPFTAPNFAHGAAGVGYFLADLYRDTEDEAYLEAALKAATYVRSNEVESGDGCLVTHTNENPSLFYLGVCHGPAGTGRLMYLLHEITEDSEWLDWVHLNMRGLLATGAPEVRTDGLWNNYGQCCGDAGIGDYALFLYRATKRLEYLDLAERIRDFLILVSENPVVGGSPVVGEDATLGKDQHAANSEQGGLDPDRSRRWPQAEHRSRPQHLRTQTGYMQGAAGIGSFLLHLATFDDAASPKVVLPEMPF